MQKILLKDFIGRVLRSTERVQFNHIDPYGHLNTTRYIEFFVNHRIHAAEEMVQCYTMDIAKELNLGFVIKTLDIDFLAPSYMGEYLEIASWVSELEGTGFTLKYIISCKDKRRAKAIGKARMITVDLKQGGPTFLPASLPTRSQQDLITNIPHIEEFKNTITGVPKKFFAFDSN